MQAGYLPDRRFGTIRALPSGRFQARWPAGNGTRGAKTFLTEAAARAHLDAVERDRQALAIASESAAAQAIAAASGHTLAGYSASWLRTRPLAATTIHLYTVLLRREIHPLLGHLPVAEITPAVVRAWHARDGVAPTPLAQSYRLLRAILTTAVDDGLLAVNPCRIRGAGTPPAPVERVAPTVAELGVLVAGIEGEPRLARYAAMVAVAGYGGLRYGEMLGLQRGDVSLDPLQVTVARAMAKVRGRWLVKPPKTRAGARTVALPEAVRPLLERHLARYVRDGADAPLFRTRTGAPPARSNVAKLIHGQAEIHLGRSDFRFHDLRVAGATAAAQAGATTKEVMARLGHASPRAAMIYQRATEARDRQVAEALDAAIAAGGPRLRVVRGEAG